MTTTDPRELVEQWFAGGLGYRGREEVATQSLFASLHAAGLAIEAGWSSDMDAAPRDGRPTLVFDSRAPPPHVEIRPADGENWRLMKPWWDANGVVFEWRPLPPGPGDER